MYINQLTGLSTNFLLDSTGRGAS